MARIVPQNLTDIRQPHQQEFASGEGLLDELVAATTSTTQAPHKGDGIGAGAIVGIVFGCIIFLAILGVIAFFVTKKIRERRKNHGEYRPHYEESLHAKNLPYIQPPNIEGLI
jgi:hypothetical protein